MKTPRITVLIALGLLGLGAVASAQADERGYGRDLMSDQERAEHRERMRSMDSDEEREAYRREHHEMMKQRAQERGIELPDEPPERGQGGGPGPGPGKGYGQ
jgi:hypothetical protein